MFTRHYMSRESAVGVATGYGLDDRRVGFRVPVGSLSLLHVVQTGSGVHPASSPVGSGDSFSSVKRLGRETDHLTATNAEIKST
jgi:hypothetical protein